MRIDRRQSGFTLIELLLSLSILSIIMVIILGALRIGVRAWEKGETVTHVQQRSRTLLDRLALQLASVAVATGAREEQPPAALIGDSRTVEFTATRPLLHARQAGPVRVKYVVEAGPTGKMRLLLYEEDITAADNFSGRPMGSGAEAQALLEAFEELRFEYLGGGGEGPDWNWTASWPGQNPTALPRAVRITYRDEMDAHDIRVIAPVRQWDRIKEEAQP